jgi:hypothetical protein
MPFLPARAERNDACAHSRNIHGKTRITCRAVSELTMVIYSPTLFRACFCNNARLAVICRNRAHTAYFTKCHRYVCRRIRNVADLTIVICPPTLHLTIFCQCAGMVTAHSNGNDTTIQTNDIDGQGRVCSRAIPHLSIRTISPALHRSHSCQCTRLMITESYINSVINSTHIHRRCRIRPRSIAKLAIVIEAPTFHLSSIGNRTRMPISA